MRSSTQEWIPVYSSRTTRHRAEKTRIHRWSTRAFDKEDYKGRNVVERNFNTIKQWRALATRCDKLALTYRGGAVLRAISIWLAVLGDTHLGVLMRFVL